MPVRQYACLVDSITIGTGGGYSIAQGGLGSYAELVAERLANIAGIGPLISSGFRGAYVQPVVPTSTEWVDDGGTWTTISSGAEDKSPGNSYYSAGAAAAIYKYQVPARWRANVGVAVYYIDRGGNWSYRKDGGSWTNMDQASPSDSKTLKKFYLPGAVATSFEVRAANAAGTSQACQIAGIELFYADPTVATQGLIMHNLGVGGQALNTRMNTTGGRDKNAFFDSVTLGTGSPITNAPSSGVFDFGNINDVDQIDNPTTYTTDLGLLKTRVVTTNGWPLGIINCYETETTFRPAADQLAYRDAAKTFAANSPVVPLIDIYDMLAAKGITGYAQTLAAGLLISDSDAHPNQAGYLYLADRIYWWLRTQFFNIGNVPSTYPVAGKLAAVQYAGKRAAVQYSAGAPIAVA